jgi:hypothetical protein
MKKIILISLALGLLVGINSSLAETKYDFGDAPDNGYFTYYGSSGASTGSFPSRLASDGARVSDTSAVWLGTNVNKEDDAQLLDADLYDDGVDVDLNSCTSSKAYVNVHIDNPGETTGTAYINMFFDWNKDGSWSGEDECAPEWAVRNFTVDLSAQERDVMVYIPEFTAGEKIKNIWYRAIVTKDERLTYLNQNGQGEFAAGEIEDYGPVIKGGKKFGAVCQPKLKVIKHGKTGKFTIQKKRGSINFTKILLANSVVANNKFRSITFAGNNKIFYRSKKVDSPKRVIFEDFQVRVRFGKTASILTTCHAAIVHSNLKATTQPPHDYTEPKLEGTINSSSMNGKTVLSGTIKPTCQTVADLGIYGFEIPLQNQHPDMSDIETEMVSLNLNGGGSTECSMTTEKITCLGTEPMQYYTDSFFDIFAEIPLIPDSLHLHMVDSQGNVVAAADLPVQ